MILTSGINQRIGRKGQLLGSGFVWTPAALFAIRDRAGTPIRDRAGNIIKARA